VVIAPHSLFSIAGISIKNVLGSSFVRTVVGSMSSQFGLIREPPGAAWHIGTSLS
jgi:hypothetical protein